MARLICVVEDDETIRTLLRMALTSFTYEVEDFSAAEPALQAIAKRMPDLLILDVMLPGMSGLDALAALRKSEDARLNTLPIMLLTAKNTELDKVAGLDAGADDYLEKPFGVMELGARVRALLRRMKKTGGDGLPTDSASKPCRQLDLVLDPQTRQLHRHQTLIPLTYKEFELLFCLMREAHRVIPREELFLAVWGFDFEGESRTLDMHIRTLRKKLGRSPLDIDYIHTVRGVGYRFMASAGVAFDR